MTEDLYTKLIGFVENGGTLFLAVPHLDTRTRNDHPVAHLREGDASALCGVHIIGPGVEVKEVFFAEQTTSIRHLMPQGTHYLEEAQLTQLELAGARVLAYQRDKPEQPVLLEHRLGRGIVYLLATWDYPGERLDAFITDILRTLADSEQTEIAVVGKDIFYAIYDGTLPSGQVCSTVYLVNHNIYGQPAYPKLIVDDIQIPIRVGKELRIAWVIDELLIVPYDSFVQVMDTRHDDSGWVISLESVSNCTDRLQNDEREIQIEVMSSANVSITLDGNPLTRNCSREGEHIVSCCLSVQNELRVNFDE